MLRNCRHARFWAVLLTVAAGFRPASAQDTAPTTRNGGARSRPAETRPADEIEAALKDLARATTAGEAGIKAAGLYERGPAARAAMLGFLRGATVVDAVFEGVVSAFDLREDAAVVPVLFEAYGRGSAARDQFVSFAFKKFDRRESLLDVALAPVEAATDDDVRRRALRIVAEVVDESSERLRATQRLVKLLETAPASAAADVRAALTQVTFHDFADAAAWKDWVERFVAQYPAGFPEAALYRSSLRQKDARFLQEVQRNIEAVVADKRPPTRYFERKSYPEAVVRRYAAKLSAQLRGAETEVVRKATEGLLLLLEGENDEETVAEALFAAGELAGRDVELAPRVAAAAQRRLGEDSATVVGAALKALARVGGDAERKSVEALYEPLRKKEGMHEARVQILSTLYALNGGYSTMVSALGDPSTVVRAAAARVLGSAKKAAAAPDVARALAIEQAPEPQLAMVKALASLDAWDDAAVGVLIDVARRSTGLVRDSAVRALLQSAASPSFPASREKAAVAAFVEVAPAAHAAEERRAALLAEFREGCAIHVEMLARWLADEGDLAAARDVAQKLAKVGADRPERLEEAAVALGAAGRNETVPTLLRAAYATTQAATASSSRRSRADEISVALARALLDERPAKDAAAETERVVRAVEADEIASKALAQRPDDARFLALRGRARAVRGDAVGAAADLRAALKSMVDASGEERRDLERRLLLALLAGNDAEAALAFLKELPAGNRDRDFLVAAGRVELAAGRRREAIARFRNAVKAEGASPAAAAEFELALALLESSATADRLEAGRIFDAFEASPGRLPEGLGLVGLRAPVEADRRARAAVQALDAADAAARAARRDDVVAQGRIAGAWLVDGLDALARGGSDAAVLARLGALRALFADDAGLRELADPGVDAPRDVWTEAAARVAAWWEQRAR